MGFTAWLAVAYLVLLMADVAAAVKGRKTLAIGLTVIMAVGIGALWLLWVSFPM